MDTDEQTFGNIVRRRRQALGIGQEAFANKAGLHRTHISLLERGKRLPTFVALKKLARALETTMADLMAEFETATAAASDSEAAQLPRKKIS